jgi:O-antigen ligase
VQQALLILLVPASYLLLAGGRPWTLVPLLAIAGAAALAAPRRTFSFPPDTRALDLSLMAIIVAIGMQLVPLPSRVVGAISPRADAITAAIRVSPLDQPQRAGTTVSVNPEATLAALATVALGVLTFWAARGAFSAGASTRAFCRWLAFFGAAAAVMAVIQRAVAPRTVLFLVEPEARSAHPFGAFVNRNHFAAWLLLVAAPVSGYCIARMHMRPARAHWRQSLSQVMSSGVVFTIFEVLVQIGVLLMTLSRSALAGLGVAASSAWLLGRSRLRLESMPLLGLAGVSLLLVVLFVDVDGWSARFEERVDAAETGAGRLTIWRESLAVVKDFWPAGTGAGTYGDAMTLYQQSRIWVGAMHRWAHFNNAHSHYLQVAVEGGLLLALPVLVAVVSLATVGRRAVRADKGEMFWVRVGAGAGLAGLAAQSVWEIALVMPANAVLAGIAAGLLLYRRDVPKTEAVSLTPELMTPRPRPARAS